MPTKGDPPAGDPHWAGSVRWGRLLPRLRGLTPNDCALADQWQLLLDVLESEGSMGFTRADLELFRAYELGMKARDYAIDFVDSLRMPLHDALLARVPSVAFDVVGKKQRAVHPYFGYVEIRFQLPATEPPRIRAGLFAHSSKLRFFVAPTKLVAAGPEVAAARRVLVRSGFRDRDLLAFLPLDLERLASPELPETIVAWADAQFGALLESGILAYAGGATPGEELDQ